MDHSSTKEINIRIDSKSIQSREGHIIQRNERIWAGTVAKIDVGLMMRWKRICINHIMSMIASLGVYSARQDGLTRGVPVIL
jgi:hypothetical protein